MAYLFNDLVSYFLMFFFKHLTSKLSPHSLKLNSYKNDNPVKQTMTNNLCKNCSKNAKATPVAHWHS